MLDIARPVIGCGDIWPIMPAMFIGFGDFI
jgi:hypothetical protein